MSARLREAHGVPGTNPEEYTSQLYDILGSMGNLTGQAETEMIEILDEARAEIQDQLAGLDFDSPSRAMLNRARGGIDQTTANMAERMGKTLEDLQAEGHALGIDLALKPLGGRTGIEAVAAGVTLEQLEIMQRFSAELIQDLTPTIRKRITGEITSVIVGAKSPGAAAKAIGLNLTDPNHFSTIAHRARAITVTEVGRASALGSQNAQRQLAKSLAEAGDPTEVRKRWLNAHLPGARATHLEAEAAYAPGGTKGPIVYNAFYQIGGFKALYPRDPSLPAGESVNCHCVSVTITDAGTEAAAENATATAKAKANYGSKKAAAAAAAEAKTKPALDQDAAAFIGSPYESAGLTPVKSLKNGGHGYGGKVMAQKLGYPNPKDSGFVWDSDLGAWKHQKAAAGKQLPDFKDLLPHEQQAIMSAAGLKASTKAQIAKHLDLKKPKPKPYTTTPPAAAPPPPPKPKPTPPPPRPPKPPPATPPAGSLPALEPAGTLHAAKKPPVTKGNFHSRIKEKLGRTSAPVNDYAVQREMKDSVMRRLAAKLETRIPAADTDRLRDLVTDLRNGGYGRGFGATPYEEAASGLVQNWAATSGNRHRYALAIQKRAAEKFDLPWPPVGYDIDLPDRGYGSTGSVYDGLSLRQSVGIVEEQYGDIIDDFLDAMYEETQEELTRLFPNKDTIRMVRGMDRPPGVNISGTIQHLPVMLNPLSSFAINSTTAKRFGRTLLYVEVPKERILGSSLSGFGCLHEYEFVVIGAAEPELMGVIAG